MSIYELESCSIQVFVLLNSIVYILQDILPKKIMFYLVSFSQKELSIKLYRAVKEQDIHELLTEYAEIDTERTNLKHTIKEFKKAIDMINEIL